MRSIFFLLRRGSIIPLTLLLLPAVGGCAHEAGRGDSLCHKASQGTENTDFPPIERHISGAPDDGTELRQRMESAYNYALDYGLSCALGDALQAPVEDVMRNPLRCGLRVELEDALEWGFRHILEPEQKAASQDMMQYARQRALENAREKGLVAAVETAIESVPIEEPVKDALKAVLVKTLSDCLDESFDFALDNALHGEPETFAPDGSFIWPVDDLGRYIGSTFGRRKGGYRGGHAGIDIVVPRGTPVMAVDDGTVIFAGESGSGYGRIVKIDHGDDLETWYAHLETFSVREGQRVARGTVIAKVGATGRATTPHLHYEVHKNSQATDPRPYLP
jgi:murein DD-endopeptidase MepM/ murein hydrolase activator NlpD